MKDNEILVITQCNNDGALYTTNSINADHEIISGYIMDFNNHEIIKELSIQEINNIIDNKNVIY